MSIKNLFYWSYWFSQPKILKTTGLAIWLAIFLILVALGLVALYLRSRSKELAYRNFLYKASGCGLTMGIFGLIWLFFRQEYIPFLAWRLWLLVWVAVFVAWAFPLIKYYFKRLPAVRAENAARAEKEKYL